MAKVTMVEAINMAHAWEMAHDPDVVVLGEDVGTNGGVFRATVGLQQRFGATRVQDTPLAEGLIAGTAIGLAAQGIKPVAEIQFMGFIYPALDQIASHMARLRNRTRGRLTCPLVLRMPHGGGIHAPEHHSESLETLLCHHPGLRVLCPSSPVRAYGLLLAAIRSPDPVIFLEPVRLYRFMKQEVEDNGEALPLEHCFVLREGSDVTLVTWGAMTVESLKAAEQASAEGISCEVIDVASLAPIDHETILDSVVKTGRLLIVHEAPRTCGVGAEIAATVAEQALYDLLTPVRRVTGYDTIMPFYRLEYDYIPSLARILDGIRAAMGD
jgi:2-oxoisovalerate dehydrogenase E1 component beta subunit